MAIMFGNGNVKTNPEKLIKTIRFYGVAAEADLPKTFEGAQGRIHSVPMQDGGTTLDVVIYDAVGDIKYDPLGKKGDAVTWPTGGLVTDEEYYMTFEMDVVANEKGTVEISGNTFPGTYYLSGDTYARSEVTGEDSYFQFIIPKGKVLSEQTITMEAEGDPSTFNLNLKVLRPHDGIMMKLVKYDMADATPATANASNYIDLSSKNGFSKKK